MAKKKTSSPTSDGQKDSDKPPSPEAMDVTGAGALTGDGSAAMPGGGGWASQHKGILIGGGIAVVVVVGYILIKSHGTASGAQSGSAMPVTDLLGGQTTPSTNSGGPGSSGYGGSGSATAIEKAITQMEDALHTQSQQNTLALQNALASQQASQSNAWQQLLAKIGRSGSTGSGSSQTAASTAASIFASGTTNAQVNEITTAEGMSALEGQAYNPNKTSNGGASASYRAAYDAAIAAGTTPPPMLGNYVGPPLPSQNSKGQFVYQ